MPNHGTRCNGLNERVPINELEQVYPAAGTVQIEINHNLFYYFL